MVIHSYAKLNLYLSVLNKRKDNYHSLITIFERISLCDKIILKPRPDRKIKIISDVPIPKSNANLTWRASRLLQEKFGIKEGLDIKIDKRIPIGSGMGGGSSNAASVLLGLNKLWRLNLTRNKLARLAQKIGSDVPFFIYNQPFAQGISRGERIKPLRALDKVKFWHILVVPRIIVSTPLIYRGWDKYKRDFRPASFSKKLKMAKRGRLTNHIDDVKILTSALKKRDFSLISRHLLNNLEPITFNLYPEVRRIKEKISQLGLKSILMSGSGPAIFGIVPSRKEAVSLARQLGEGNSSWQVFVARTI